MAYDRGEFLGRPQEVATSSEDELVHFGVKGMKWGKRKAPESGSDSSAAKKTSSGDKPAKRELTPAQKKARRDIAVRLAAVGVLVAAKKGAQWAANNPDKITQFTQRAQNVMNGTKSLGPGYDVFKLTLKNGVYG